jgi:hypothetical protein
MYSIYRSKVAVQPVRSAWEEGTPELREAIVRASERLDKRLCREPHRQGESRGGKARVAFEAPLGVIFEVDEGMKLVSILRAWIYETARRGWPEVE